MPFVRTQTSRRTPRTSIPTQLRFSQPQDAATNEDRLRSAEHDRLGQASLAGLFVLAVHVFGGLTKSRDGLVEIDAMPGRDLVTGDRVRGPRFDGPERTPLDARHLDVTGDRIARHAEV